jgi:outer membrane protein OmpA-like peptidoglycan-associated protein
MPALTIAPRSLAVAALGMVAALGPAWGQYVTTTGLPPPERLESRLIALPEDGSGAREQVHGQPVPLAPRSPGRTVVFGLASAGTPSYTPRTATVTGAAPPPLVTVTPAPTSPSPPPPVAAPAARPAALAALPPEPAASSPRGTVAATIPFPPLTANLSDVVKADLDRVAKTLSDRKPRGLEVHAYAGDGDPESRKIALARALVVRSYLIDRGVKTRIEVGAFSGSGERVDILVPSP